MIDKNKSLIPKEKSFFNKISNFFKNIFSIFNKKNIEKQKENLEELNNEERKENSNKTENFTFIENDNRENNSKNSQNNKFMEIYLEDYFETDEELESNDELKSSKIENLEESKKNFFRLYNDVKAGNVDMNYLSGSDLVKINLMLKEELNLKKN